MLDNCRDGGNILKPRSEAGMDVQQDDFGRKARWSEHC